LLDFIARATSGLDTNTFYLPSALTAPAEAQGDSLMGSVSVTWRGGAPSLPARGEFLAHLRQLAEANDQLLRERANAPRNPFLEFMTASANQTGADV